jgi:hypothetical protein
LVEKHGGMSGDVNNPDVVNPEGEG